MKINETNRTLVYVGVAVLSIGAAALAHHAARPKADTDYQSVGSEFYPDFQDPTAAQMLRVVAYDKDTATAKVFEVEYKNGKWLIPSHHNYPADGKDRLARTAASVIGTTRNALVSRVKSEQPRYDVVDPEDTDPNVQTGRGQKITIAKSDGTPLAEFIIGKQAEGQPDVYYVRGTKTDDANAIYLAKLKIDISTKFSDWIEPDLLKVDREKLTDIRSDNYSIDEARRAIIQGEITELSRKTPSDPWTLAGLKSATEDVKTDVVNQIVNNLDGLRLVGVRPKPQGVNPDLSIDKRIAESPELAALFQNDMASRGFHLAVDPRSDKTKLLSNEGEFEAGTSEGVRYLLHFGQIFTGTEFDIETGLTKSNDKSKDAKKSASEKNGSTDTVAEKTAAAKTAAEKTKEPVKKGRYLMVYTVFDPKLVGDPPLKPSEPKKPNGLVHIAPAGDDSHMLALASADSKADAKPGDSAKAAPAAAAKNPPAKNADKSKPASAKPGAASKPAAKPASKPASKPAAKKPDPKAEYERAMSQYKKEVERYENDKSEFEKKLKNGEKKVKGLNDRFGPWYYVISAESFENLRLTHAGLVKPKEAPGAKKETGPPAGGSMSFPGR